MKYVAYITSLLLLILCSCSDEVSPDVPGKNLPDGTPVDVVVGAQMPEMSFAASRAMGEQPTVDELKNSLYINLFVFDESGVMLQFIPPEDIKIEDVVDDKVFFRVHGIMTSSQPRRLHFVVTSAEDLTQIEGGEYITAMASEYVIMSSLLVDGDTDVYWGWIEKPAITDNTELNIKLLRNFAKISVSESANNFELLGYTVVNRPSKGTVAPYIAQSHQFAKFVNDDGSMVPYDDITNVQNYHGINPAGSDATMTHTSEADVQASLDESVAKLSAGEESPYYIFERSQSDISSLGSNVTVTYLIVKGRYNRREYYYKLDLGHMVNGDFTFYDLLRNFHFLVDIRTVEGPGAATLHDAMVGMTHNNVSASVVTRDLFAISSSDEIIEVSATQAIFTEKTVNYRLRFRYTIPSGTIDPAKLCIYDMNKDDAEHFNMSGANAAQGKSINLSGEVISTDLARLSGPDADNWYTLSLTTNDIPADASRKEQTLRVYYSGDNSENLGRTVTLMLRQPWTIPDAEIVDTDTDAEIGGVAPGRGSEFTVKFTVPPGLATSQFPLTLSFESDKQNIYAKKGAMLHVVTGRSGFKGATTDNVMHYEWHLAWADYDPEKGTVCRASFVTHTTTDEDIAYNTRYIDTSTANGARSKNNGTAGFCIRIANVGMKCIEPYYVNVIREAQ